MRSIDGSGSGGFLVEQANSPVLEGEATATPRRHFLFGSAAIALAAALNVGVLHRFAKAQAKNDAEALRLRADMDQALAAAKTEQQLALKRAGADKYIALQEMEQQRAENGAFQFSDTIGFAELKHEFRWLENSRKSVAALKGNSEFGSAVLLDRDGTVALCAHEIHERDRQTVRLYFQSSHDRSPIEFKLHDFILSKNHDLMFATIDPVHAKKHGLLPIQWGYLGYKNIEDAVRSGNGNDIIFVGWPAPSFRLHATRAILSGIHLKNTYQNNLGSKIVLSCKAKADGVTFGGMSGGAVLRNQCLVGIINASTAPGVEAITDFTPVDLVRESYIALYPQRARIAGTVKIEDFAMPAECRFDHADFVEARLSRRDP